MAEPLSRMIPGDLIQSRSRISMKHLSILTVSHMSSVPREISFIVLNHYSDEIMSAMASQITDVSIVYSTVCAGADQRKHQSSASLAFVRGIHRRPVNSPHKGPVTRKTFPFGYVIMFTAVMFYLQWIRVINWHLMGGRLEYFKLTLENRIIFRHAYTGKRNNILSLYIQI